MADPRIQRTKEHVLRTVRELLGEFPTEPLTFTTLAAAAHVSRRTLYTYWSSIEQVIGDAVLTVQIEAPTTADERSPRERLGKFLTDVRDDLHQAPVQGVLIALLSGARSDAEIAQTLQTLHEERVSLFRSYVSPISDSDFTNLIGPIVYSELFLRQPLSDDAFESLISQLAKQLALS